MAGSAMIRVIKTSCARIDTAENGLIATFHYTISIQGNFVAISSFKYKLKRGAQEPYKI